MSHPSVSVITTCKGRLTHLRQTLPLMLSQNYEGPLEVIVVDYGCPDGAADYVESLGLARCRAVRVTQGVEWWHPGRARNIGARSARGEWLSFLDADFLTRPDYIDRAVHQLAQFPARLGCPQMSHCELFGACVIESTWFHHLRGYDEALNQTGYGWDDIDLYHRSTAHGQPPLRLGSEGIIDIKHSDAERTRFLREQSIQAGLDANIALSHDSQRVVNTAGYGRLDR